MVYPATLRCRKHQPPASRTPTPSQHQAPSTFPAMPSTHPSPLKYLSLAFHQPTLSRTSATADLARLSPKIILPRQTITSPGARARALSSLVNMRHRSRARLQPPWVCQVAHRKTLLPSSTPMSYPRVVWVMRNKGIIRTWIMNRT